MANSTALIGTFTKTVIAISVGSWNVNAMANTTNGTLKITAKPKTVYFKYQKITEKQVLQTGTVTSNKQVQDKQVVQSEKKDKEVTRSSLSSCFQRCNTQSQNVIQ